MSVFEKRRIHLLHQIRKCNEYTSYWKYLLLTVSTRSVATHKPITGTRQVHFDTWYAEESKIGQTQQLRTKELVPSMINQPRTARNSYGQNSPLLMFAPCQCPRKRLAGGGTCGARRNGPAKSKIGPTQNNQDIERDPATRKRTHSAVENDQSSVIHDKQWDSAIYFH